MDWNTALSAVNYATAATAQYANAHYSYKNQKKLATHQAELNKDIARFNQDMMNETYEKYASPSALVEQYKQAGLNPASLAGTSQNVATASADGTSIAPNSKDIMDPHALASSVQMALQMDQVQSNINLQNSTADLQDTQAALNDYELKRQQKKDLGGAVELELNAMSNQNRLVLSQAIGQETANKIADLQHYILDNTKQDQIDLTKEKVNYMKENALSLNWDNIIKEARSKHAEDIVVGELASVLAGLVLAEATAEWYKSDKERVDEVERQLRMSNCLDAIALEIKLCSDEDENGKIDYFEELENAGEAAAKNARKNSSWGIITVDYIFEKIGNLIGLALGGKAFGKAAQATKTMKKTSRQTALLGPDGKPMTTYEMVETMN